MNDPIHIMHEMLGYEHRLRLPSRHPIYHNLQSATDGKGSLGDSGRFGKRRFGRNIEANVSAKKYAETSQAKTIAETFRMICGAYPVYVRSPSPSQRP